MINLFLTSTFPFVNGCRTLHFFSIIPISFANALNPVEATKLYDYFNNSLKLNGVNTQTGVFGADMQISLVNDGPVTIVLDSKILFK